MVRVHGLSIAVLLLACGPNVDSDGTGADESSSSSGGTTPGSTSPTTTMSTTLSTTDATTTTTGVPPGCNTDFVSGCQSYCAAVVTCDPANGPYEDCVTSCIDELAAYTPECQIAFCEGYACVGTLDCATLANGIGECSEIFSAAGDLCGVADEGEVSDDGDTACTTGGDEIDCSWACDMDGFDRELSCSGGTCFCFQNGAEVGSCPDGGICEIPDSLEEYAKGCCGW
ncbi:MAG: hypothetical protein IAG13_07025 [Deltaproteobacteria bacterium]|nr:hypothetical protein [Nannocystaceae bacterium]